MRQAAIIASMRATVSDSGFSTRTGSPCSAAAKTASSCPHDAVATVAMPTPADVKALP